MWDIKTQLQRINYSLWCLDISLFLIDLSWKNPRWQEQIYQFGSFFVFPSAYQHVLTNERKRAERGGILKAGPWGGQVQLVVVASCCLYKSAGFFAALVSSQPSAFLLYPLPPPAAFSLVNTFYAPSLATIAAQNQERFHKAFLL